MISVRFGHAVGVGIALHILHIGEEQADYIEDSPSLTSPLLFS